MTASDTCLENPRSVTFWAAAYASIGNIFCRTFHGAISRPVNGKYRCWKCLREFDLEW